jgi:hypothetical protein
MTKPIVPEAAIRFKAEYATKVFVSEQAYVCIKQTSPQGAEQVVQLTMNQLQKILAEYDYLFSTWVNADVALFEAEYFDDGEQ